MNGFDVALSRLVNSPDLLGVMLWAALFGLGARILVSGVIQGAARPGLAERLARLDVDARLEQAVQARPLAVPPGRADHAAESS